MFFLDISFVLKLMVLKEICATTRPELRSFFCRSLSKKRRHNRLLNYDDDDDGGETFPMNQCMHPYYFLALSNTFVE